MNIITIMRFAGLLTCTLLVGMLSPLPLFAGDQNNPEITDPANDQVGNQAGQI